MKNSLHNQIDKASDYNDKSTLASVIVEQAEAGQDVSPTEGAELPEILFVSSYPNRECGIATYCQDLIKAIKDKFGRSFAIKVCALENKEAEYVYSDEVKYKLQTSDLADHKRLAEDINADKNIKLVFFQHEFGLFSGDYGDYFLQLLKLIQKPVITTFHTVLPSPDENRKKLVQSIAELTGKIIVMTQAASVILQKEYAISPEKISVIYHGTHLVNSLDVVYANNLENRFVLSTFGLLNSGKSIETAINALPTIIEKFPNVLYLIIGKTHPGIIKQEGEKYRDFLESRVAELGLQHNVKFINKYLSLEELLGYLQHTTIYLFTSKDPFQAVSGTFSYALACGCPVISTPIPHAVEMLQDGTGTIIDFQNSKQLSDATIKLLSDPDLLHQMKLNGLHKIVPTAWENSAIAHIELFNNQIGEDSITLQYNWPALSLSHIKNLTTDFGMIQFSQIDKPDLDSGYTIDDNARALIAVCKHYKLTTDTEDLKLIEIYLNYIVFCQQEDGNFLNYVDIEEKFFEKNKDENLEDANGRAIWALGEFMSFKDILPSELIEKAKITLEKALPYIRTVHSPRAISFSIKGLYYLNLNFPNPEIIALITRMADDLVSKFRGVTDKQWKWFEEYLTYANSVLPEAMLYAHLATKSKLYKDIAVETFDFLLSEIFDESEIKVISNQGWHIKGETPNNYGEQPIDVAYTIMALALFYETFNNKEHLKKMIYGFDWFLGKNHLHQIMYNPRTGGCYDGLEELHVNLNQGAESTVSYLLSRLTIEKYREKYNEIYLNEQMIQNRIQDESLNLTV